MNVNVNNSVRAVLPEIPELRQATRALEGVFLSQLFQAMRATVPEGGFMESSSAQATFQSMFDEKMAETLAQRTDGGIGDMLYEQLRRRIHNMTLTPGDTTPS